MATHEGKNDHGRRWARVPTGNETCGFCFMLSSRGYDYLTAKSAGEGDGHSHFYDSCDCMIVQEPADGGEVDGYNYKAMGKHFNRYYEAFGGDVNKACKALGDDLYATKKLVEAGVLDPVEYSHFGIWEYWSVCAKALKIAKRPDEAENVSKITAAFSRAQNRRSKAEMLNDSLYAQDKPAIEREAAELESKLKKLWGMKDKSQYLEFIRSSALDGSIDAEAETQIFGKELQLARWLSSLGWNIRFRNANKHKDTDGKTSDFLIDEVLWEAKRIESPHLAKIARRITQKLDRQGPRFIVDLSTNSIEEDLAEFKIALLLDDPKIEEIMIVRDGYVKLLRK